jgi:hypothetical protein
MHACLNSPLELQCHGYVTNHESRKNINAQQQQISRRSTSHDRHVFAGVDTGVAVGVAYCIFAFFASARSIAAVTGARVESPSVVNELLALGDGDSGIAREVEYPFVCAWGSACCGRSGVMGPAKSASEASIR